MYNPHLYLTVFFVYLAFSAAVVGAILSGGVDGGASIAHMIVTVFYGGYVILYRRHRASAGLPTHGVGLFR